MSATEIDVAIVGGGILGLLAAREIHTHSPNLDLAVFEKEVHLGEHTSSRNSGVLHAGLYYPHNSMKHRHCLEGNQLWEQLAQDLDIPLRRTGKLIVANASQVDELDELYKKAQKNSVEIREASSEELKLLANHLQAAKAISSPSSGILDASEAIHKIQADLFKKNIPVLAAQKVTDVQKLDSGFSFKVGEDEIRCQKLINCAGLEAVELRKSLGLTDFENFFVKGHYVKTNQRFPFEKLIYPVPPRDLKGLGVHITFDFQGDFKFGPNTQDVSSIDYSMQDSIVDEMYPAIEQLFKGVDKAGLYADYAGIRPKLKRAGELYADFWIGTQKEHQIPGYLEFLGIESPGLTAAPSLVRSCLTVC